ncbi:MAG TPA: hypothetical protein VJ890_03365 [Vineibacter sp.]|nr:hypothetical protein [Vineibacter sp.]
MIRCASLALAVILVAVPAPAQEPLSGNWSGLGLEVSGNSETQIYPIDVRLDASGGGAIDYPDLGCGGSLTPLRTVGGVREFRETLSYGIDNCVDGGTVGLFPKDDRLIFYWTGEGTAQPDSVVSAVLRAVASKTRMRR